MPKALAKEIKLNNRRVRIYPLKDHDDPKSYIVEFQSFDRDCSEGDYDVWAGGARAFTERKSRTVQIKLSEEALNALGVLISEVT